MLNVKKKLIVPNVSRETMISLKAYYSLLMSWNKSQALTEELNEKDFFDRHIYDALQLIDILPGLPLLDMGSGCGIPAIPLLISGRNVSMVESCRKKSVFLNHAVKVLNLKAEVVNDRIENIFYDFPICVTARALKSLNILLGYMCDVSRETIGVFLKGKRLAEEIHEAEKTWMFNYEIFQSVGDGYVIVVTDVRKRISA